MLFPDGVSAFPDRVSNATPATPGEPLVMSYWHEIISNMKHNINFNLSKITAIRND